MTALASAVTPVILTFNEEANIGRVLDELSWANRVVVIDSFSTDATVAVAARYSFVEVFQRSFDNHTDQWNFGLSKVETPWVLSLDADYILSKDWSVLVRRDTSEFDKQGYCARFTYCVLGRPLRASLYPPRIVLFRRESCRYVPDGHTQLLQVDGGVGMLNELIFHDDRKPLSSWLEAQARYTELEVRKLVRSARPDLGFVDRLRAVKWVMPLLMPLYCLLVKGLVLDGSAGCYYAFQRTYAELLLSLRLLEQRSTVESQSQRSGDNTSRDVTIGTKGTRVRAGRERDFSASTNQ